MPHLFLRTTQGPKFPRNQFRNCLSDVTGSIRRDRSPPVAQAWGWRSLGSIVENHQGQIQVESKVGAGTVILVVLQEAIGV